MGSLPMIAATVQRIAPDPLGYICRAGLVLFREVSRTH